jgi:arylsulfatase A-like enzyme
MYADDLGYGDVGCYRGTGIPTPNVDRMAASGLKFLQGYATAATCTPSRYSLLTGSYPWRNPRAEILPGDAPLIIDPATLTLPSMLKRAGYAAGVVGKWHLGLGAGNLDWNRSIPLTPLDVGFDTSFIMAATNDRVPCVYVNGREVEGLDPRDPISVTYDNSKAFPGLPTGRSNPELLKMRYSHGHDCSIVNGVSRIGHMKGGASALWKDEEMAQVFLDRAVGFVEANRSRPFFLYYALHQPHVPRIPGRRFAGRTGLGARGDVIAEMDWCVGEMLAALEKNGLGENTIVIFSSDNGPVLDDGYEDRAVELCGDHRPAGPLRGGKYSLFDGGTRVPFVIRWPGMVQPGESGALVCHLDFLASFAAMLGVTLDDAAAPDSFNVIDALLGTSGVGRREIALEGMMAQSLLRQGNWVYIPPYDGPAVKRGTGTETGYSLGPQLYDLSRDLGQICNEAGMRPGVVGRMSRRLESIRAGGKTRQEDPSRNPG